MAHGTSGHSGVGGGMTSGSSGGLSSMEGRAGDSSSWFEQVTHEEAWPGACKRKKLMPDCGHLATPSPLNLRRPGRRRWVLSMSTQQAESHLRKNITSRAISAYYPDFTPAAVKTVVSQVLCMIAKYHLACATRGSTTTSPILPKAVEQYLPPLVDYTHPGGTGLTDVRVCDHKSSSLRVGVWLHQMDMSLSWEREASESMVPSRHIRGPLLNYLLAPGTSNLHFEEVVSRVLQENWEKHERVKERFRSLLNSSHHQWTRLSRELDELSQGMEAAADRKVHKEIEERMGIL